MKRLLVACIAGAPALACSAGATLRPLDERGFQVLAQRVERELRRQAPEAVRAEFHRRQGFAWQAEDGRSARLLSLHVQAAGQVPRCLLAFEQQGRLQLVDARAGDAAMSWACEGEPAMTLADVDRDGLSDLLVLYPYRAPSGARFHLPLVLRHRGPQAGVVPDEARTHWLREPTQVHPPVTTLKQLKRLLQRFPGP